MTAAHGWAVVRERRFYHVGGLTRDEGEAGIRIVMVDNLDKEYCADRARAVDGAQPSTISSPSSRVCHRSTYR